jgi:hypothetical protein
MREIEKHYRSSHVSLNRLIELFKALRYPVWQILAGIAGPREQQLDPCADGVNGFRSS